MYRMSFFAVLGLCLAASIEGQCQEIGIPAYESLADGYAANRPFTWWRLDEPDEAKAYDTMSRRDGIRKSVRGNSFDGKESRIELGALDVESDKISILAWFRAENFKTEDARIISKAVGVNNPDHYWMLSTINEKGEMRLRCRLKLNGTTHLLVADQGKLGIDEWNFAAVVYNGEQIQLYLNGDPVGSVKANGKVSTNSHAHAWIGANPYAGGARFFHGQIKDVALFDHPISPASIAAIYRAGARGGEHLTEPAIASTAGLEKSIAESGDRISETISKSAGNVEKSITDSAAGIQKSIKDVTNGIETVITDRANGIESSIQDSASGIETAIADSAGTINKSIMEGVESIKQMLANSQQHHASMLQTVPLVPAFTEPKVFLQPSDEMSLRGSWPQMDALAESGALALCPQSGTLGAWQGLEASGPLDVAVAHAAPTVVLHVNPESVDPTGHISSQDLPSFWTSIPYGPLSVRLKFEIDSDKPAATDYIQFLLDGEPLNHNRFDLTVPAESEMTEDGRMWMTYIYSVSCPPLGKHILQARYLRDNVWSALSLPLRFDVRVPETPEIISISDSQDVGGPLRESLVEISSDVVQLKLAKVNPADQVIFYLDGKRIGKSWVNGGCCTSVNIASSVAPGVYTLSVRVVPQGATCNLASKMSKGVEIRYYDANHYVLHQKESKSFAFASAAYFPIRDFGPRGEVIDREGAVIYEDMIFAFDDIGNYHVTFDISTPAVPTTIRLRFLVQAKNSGRWYTITLDPLEFQPEKGKDGRYKGKSLHGYVAKGQSEALRRLDLNSVGEFSIRREGSARFGFGLEGLGQRQTD